MPKSNFDIKTDLQVIAMVPDQGTFIIGFSELGGPDVLGGYSPFTLKPGTGPFGITGRITFPGQPIDCEVASVETSRGFAVEESVYFQAQSQSAQVTLRANWLNPVTQGALRLGKPIAIAHKEDGTSTLTQMFVGWITNIDVQFEPNNMALVNLVIYDALQFLGNIPGQLIQSGLMPPGTKGLENNLNYLLDGIPMPYDPIFGVVTDRRGSSGFWTTVEPYVFDPNKPILETLNAFMLSELGALWADYKLSRSGLKDYTHVEIITVANDDIIASLNGAPDYIISNDHTIEDHYCLGPIEWSAEIDKQIKTASATTETTLFSSLALNETNFYLNLGNELEFTTVNSGSGGTSTESLLAEWGSRVVLTNSNPVPSSILLNAIDDEGTLRDIVDAEPAESARIKFDQESGTIDKTYLITRITNRVTADGWLVNLELWRN
jgi:hypothetical protein